MGDGMSWLWKESDKESAYVLPTCIPSVLGPEMITFFQRCNTYDVHEAYKPTSVQKNSSITQYTLAVERIQFSLKDVINVPAIYLIYVPAMTLFSILAGFMKYSNSLTFIVLFHLELADIKFTIKCWFVLLRYMTCKQVLKSNWFNWHIMACSIQIPTEIGNAWHEHAFTWVVAGTHMCGLVLCDFMWRTSSVIRWMHYACDPLKKTRNKHGISW